LKLSGTKISNNSLEVIAKMSNLTRLSLDHTIVNHLAALSNLTELRYLNLASTNVTLQNLNELKELKYLQQLYLFDTNITRADSIQIQLLLPKTKLDFGNYQVATLTSDTTALKAKR
jgi:Leucine-rich repeat (LRR) protein